MSEKILNFCTISGESVKKFEGIKKYIATGDIIDNKISSYAEVDYSNKPSRANQIAKFGEVIFAKMKDTIKVITINKENSEYIYSTGFYIIKPKANVLTDYLYWLFNSPKFNIDKDKYCKGATQKALNNEGLGKIEINKLPDIKIQENIVYKLNKVNDILNKKKEQINTLDELIKSQFVEMFGDPILNPMNWEVKKLKDISNKIMSGNTPKGGDRVYVSSGIEFYRSQNVWKNRIEKEDIAYIDKETHKNMIKSSLKHKDLLITKTGRINTENSSLGRTAIYTGEDDKANINGHVYLVRLNEGENHEFVLRILISDRYREYIRSVCVGGIDKRQLNKEHIEDFPIIYPPKELQKEFTDKVKQIDKQKFEIENSLKAMQELYESLMEKYFG